MCNRWPLVSYELVYKFIAVWQFGFLIDIESSLFLFSIMRQVVQPFLLC